MSKQPYDIPHLAFPIRVANGIYVTDLQGSNGDVTTSVRNICSFERGSRIERPDFGIEDPTLRTMPIDIDDIARSIAVWEPRAEVELDVVIDLNGSETLNVRVAVPFSEIMR